MKTITTTIYTSDDGKKRFRIVELRPDVFSVEEHKKDYLAGFIPTGVRYWEAVKHYRVPGVPEYSPRDVTEFDFNSAFRYVEAYIMQCDLQNVRENPPQGYPRAI